MPKIRDLSGKETVVVATRAHMVRLFPGIAWALLTLGGSAAVMYFSRNTKLSGWYWGMTILTAVIVITIVLIIPVLIWRRKIYVVTNRRIVTREGLISKRGRDIPLNRITDVGFEASAAERVLGIGTIFISDASENPPLVWSHIPRARRTQQAISELLYGGKSPNLSEETLEDLEEMNKDNDADSPS